MRSIPSASSGSRTSPGSTSWISTPAPIAGAARSSAPPHSVGRPLAPRTLTIQAWDCIFRRYPVFGAACDSEALVGGIFTEDEIWSCTTCGACEAECPLLIEYIDKIVDLRRGLVDGGKTPQSLHKPLKALESRGNPFGKLEKKRGEWARGVVPRSHGTPAFRTLYFADSISSYDDRMQSIACAAARILGRLAGFRNPWRRGARQRARRAALRRGDAFPGPRAHNTEAIRATGARRIVTADRTPSMRSGTITGCAAGGAHQPGAGPRRGNGRAPFLGRPMARSNVSRPLLPGAAHDLYEEPRRLLDAIPACDAWRWPVPATAPSAAAAGGWRCSTNRMRKSAWRCGGCAWRRRPERT